MLSRYNYLLNRSTDIINNCSNVMNNSELNFDRSPRGAYLERNLFSNQDTFTTAVIMGCNEPHNSTSSMLIVHCQTLQMNLINQKKQQLEICSTVERNDSKLFEFFQNFFLWKYLSHYSISKFNVSSYINFTWKKYIFVYAESIN